MPEIVVRKPVAIAISEQQPVFQISLEELAMLEATLPKTTYKPGKPIFHADQHDDTLYFVKSGRVRLYNETPDEQTIEFGISGEREFFGEVAPLYDGIRTASAQALEATEVLFLHEHELDAFLTQHPRITRLIMEAMAYRLHRSALQMRSASLVNDDAKPQRRFSTLDAWALGTVRWLGSLWFILLFVGFMVTWGWLYRQGQFDKNLVGLALTLSVVQIVFAVAVLNGQNRAAAHEQKLSDREHHAIIKVEKELRSLHAKADARHTELLHRLLETQQTQNKP